MKDFMEDFIARDILSGVLALAGIYLLLAQGNIPFFLLFMGISRLNYYQKGWENE